MDAADSVMQEQTRKLAIQRRYQSDMRDIWFMQPRFERATAKTIWRMLDQPRFRASVDFLQLRAEAREVDSVRAQWWMDLANADDATRAEMIERSEEHTSELQSQMRNSYAVFCLKKKTNNNQTI